MTDLVPYEQGRSLVTWAQEADAAYVLAERMVDTAFCPAQFKGKPVEAAAAVLAGAEVGLSPLAALRSFDIIQGTAAPRALTLRAIAQAAGCQFQTVEESERKVVMRARRPGGEWEQVTWTIERAQKLKLTGKDNWTKQPMAMLVARATAELARRVAADRILGLGYAAEEQDHEDTPTTGKRTVKRQTPAATEPAPPSIAPEPRVRSASLTAQAPTSVAAGLPPLPGDEEMLGRGVQDVPLPEVPSEAAPEDRPGYITKAQLRMLHALLNKAGLTDRDEALAYYAANNGGRVVDSSKDLTRIEATRVIDALVAFTDAADDPEPGFGDDPEPSEFLMDVE